MISTVLPCSVDESEKSLSLPSYRLLNSCFRKNLFTKNSSVKLRQRPQRKIRVVRTNELAVDSSLGNCISRKGI